MYRASCVRTVLFFSWVSVLSLQYSETSLRVARLIFHLCLSLSCSPTFSSHLVRPGARIITSVLGFSVSTRKLKQVLHDLFGGAAPACTHPSRVPRLSTQPFSFVFALEGLGINARQGHRWLLVCALIPSPFCVFIGISSWPFYDCGHHL